MLHIAELVGVAVVAFLAGYKVAKSKFAAALPAAVTAIEKL
jgi:hypothetical protein